MNRYHVHLTVSEKLTGDEIATVTVTLGAHDDQEAQAIAWQLFDNDVYDTDTQEIEEAE